MIFDIIKRNTILKRGLKLPLLGVMLLAIGATSCDNSFIFDDTSDCEPGINLRFVYDYHMEPGANAFAANVDCVNVLVFDTEGNYLKHFTETSDALKADDYRMRIPLDEGNYHFVVYGGITCDNPSFKFVPDWFNTRAEGGTKDDIRVSLPHNELYESSAKLHDIVDRTGGLFYGTLDVTITEKDWTDYFRTETVYLMKDTNNIQVILQELASPYTADYEEYEFRIIDDNFVLDGYNNVINIADENLQPSYTPYGFENRLTGYIEAGSTDGSIATEDASRPVQVACAEFSTSRLLVEHIDKARLVITSKIEKDRDGNPKVIIDLPVITYLAATRGFGNNWIKSDQEYLDRQSSWTMLFFLQRNAWVKTQIVVNSWTVRINDVEL